MIKMIKTPIFFILIINFCFACGNNPSDKHSKEKMNGFIKPTLSNMVLVEGGKFKMGGNGKYDGKPVHMVILRNFRISKYEVTNREFAAFLNLAESRSKDEELAAFGFKNSLLYGSLYPKIFKKKDIYHVNTGHENEPVTGVKWKGAFEYCRFIGGRLPTEAEWEFAAIGGNLSKGFKFSGDNKLNNVANTGRKPTRVGSKLPNELGIYDITGNAFEWCNDWYLENYSASPSENPTGPKRGSFHVVRGGGFDIAGPEHHYYVKKRNYGVPPDANLHQTGFRCACDE